MVRARDFRFKESEVSTMIFEAKYYLLDLYSIIWQSGNSLSATLESSVQRTSTFPHRLCHWHGKQDESHHHICLHWKLF